MKCPFCKADLPPGSNFCCECGTPLVRTCPICAHGNAATSKFCRQCGATLTGEPPSASERTAQAPASLASGFIAEHRQLSVMFCDLVGSVTLSERLDAEDLRELLTSYQRRATSIIEAAGGLVARYQGDGILAYFGYPAANEDDAERAVRAALELIKRIGALGPDSEQLKVRIGIATGTVIVGELVASAAADQPPVVGVTPNLAARLQAIAEPNSVIIGPSTRRLTGGLFEYAELGQRNLKGFSQAIPVWQVLGESSGSSRFEALRSAK